ncbi:MAG: DNA-binding protein HU-beta, partial [uncultured Rubrobacteraceae bacterium]
EQDGAHREDRTGGRCARGRGPEALRGLRAGRHGGAQGRRRGPDNGLRQVLRQGAQGQGGPQPPDRREDEDQGFQGPLLQRGQRPQASRL